MNINPVNNTQHRNQPSFQAFVVHPSAREHFSAETLKVVEKNIQSHPQYKKIDLISRILGGDIVLSHSRPNDKHHLDTDFYFVAGNGKKILQRTNQSPMESIRHSSSPQHILKDGLNFAVDLLITSHQVLNSKVQEANKFLNKGLETLSKGNDSKDLSGFRTVN